MWGIGPQLAERLAALGVHTLGDLAHHPPEILKGAFGIIGPQLREAANGHDRTPLIPYHQGVDPKSMGHEVTLPADSRDPAALEGTLLRLSDQVARRLRGEGWMGRTVTLKLRDHRFVTHMRQRSRVAPTADHAQIYSLARALWHGLWDGEPVRLIGVSVSHLTRIEAGDQIELFTTGARGARLREALDQVRDKLGEASVVPAGALGHLTELGHVPFGVVAPKSSRRT
jgi:nucleotidyltransferase/DNA polymerase involved in DNA repair